MRGMPSPPAPPRSPLIPRKRGLQERGDSGGRLEHPIAVYDQYEHRFGPPLTAHGSGVTQARVCGLRWRPLP
jgi:hypothetical protein